MITVMERPATRKDGRPQDPDCEAVNPSRAEIYAQAAELRASREKNVAETAATVAGEFAANVITINARAIHTWSKFWIRGYPGRHDYLELLGDAMQAQEFFTESRKQFVGFSECCRLLRTDRDAVWAKVWRDCDPTAWCLLVGLRALEMISLELSGDQLVDEPESLVIEEWQPPEE